jgi:hypothetical protein
MDIAISNICNLLSLKLIAEYYDVDYQELEGYYQELAADSHFLTAVDARIDACRDLYPKGLFLHRAIDSVDWFGNQRVVLYVLIRLLKPKVCLETGVFYGGTSAFILNALARNKEGRLVSIDLPGNELERNMIKRHERVGDSEIIPEGLETGFIIPEFLKDKWELILGDSLDVLKGIKEQFEFYAHDSEHSYRFVMQEMELAKSKMSHNGTMFADDINWSNGFLEFAVKHKLYPLLLTDNAKFDLLVRLGLIRLDHPNNGKCDVTG